jgi:AMOP domain
VPLGWFMKDQVQYDYGGGWANTACRNWYSTDSQTTAWHTYLQPCPCTLNQSYVDFGRFLPTPDCNLNNYNQPGACSRNQGAIACYQSTNAT